MSSSINDWQDTADLDSFAALATTTELRNVEIPPSLEIERVLIYDDVFGAVKEALRTMPPKRREAFILGRIQGEGHQEVAQRMGISVRTVEKHIELASKDIKKALESL